MIDELLKLLDNRKCIIEISDNINLGEGWGSTLKIHVKDSNIEVRNTSGSIIMNILMHSYKSIKYKYYDNGDIERIIIKFKDIKIIIQI